MQRRPFLSSPEFGGKISDRNRIIKLNQTLQKHFAPRNLLNQQKIDAYEQRWAVTS